MEEEVAGCVDDEIFVGPITLHEMKLRLLSKYNKPASKRRNTVIGLSTTAVEKLIVEEDSAAAGEECVDSLDSQEDSVVTIDDSSDEYEKKGADAADALATEISIITLSSSDENEEERKVEVCEPETICNVKKEVSMNSSCLTGITDLMQNYNLNPSLPAGTEKETSSSISYSADVSTNCDRLEGEETKKRDIPNLHTKTTFFKDLSLNSSDENVNDFLSVKETEKEGLTSTFSFNAYCDDSLNVPEINEISFEKQSNSGLLASSSSHNSSNTEMDIYVNSSNEENKPKQKRKPKSTKNKYDYLMSSVGQYIKQQKPMRPPVAPPRSIKKPQLITPNVMKNPAYKHIVSPLSVYIKNAPSAPIFQQVTPKQVTKFRDTKTSTKSTSKIPTFDNIPKVIYRSASKVVVSETRTQQLPNCVRKLCLNNPKCVAHKGRVNNTENIDISKQLEKTDVSAISNTAFGEDISVLSVKDGYIY